MAITNARLLGALIKVLSSDTGANLLKCVGILSIRSQANREQNSSLDTDGYKILHSRSQCRTR
jgi:hypothetical protein